LREFTEHGAESKNWADIHLFCRPDYSLYIESVAEEIHTAFTDTLKQELSEIDLTGLVLPVLTPFDKDNKVDETAYTEHLKFLSDHGVHRILTSGTTGEFFSLTPEERKLTLALACEYFPGVVMFQAGSDSLEQTEREAEWADQYGADAIVALPPYYFAEAPEKGIINYFNQLGSKLSIPLIIYNFPHHTQNTVTPEMAEKISHYGIKDSSGNIALAEKTEFYYSAGPLSPLDVKKAGACGFVAGEANFYPELYVKLEAALKTGQLEEAESLQQQASQAAGVVSGIDHIGLCKEAVKLKVPSYPVSVRLPLIAPSVERLAAVKEFFKT